MKKDEEINQLFTTVVLSRLFLLMVCWIGSGVYIIMNKDNTILCECAIALSFCLLGYCLQQNWLFQGKQDMKVLSLISIVGRVISTILVFLLVKSANDLLIYCVLYAISPLISGVAGFFIGMIKYKITFVNVTSKDIWEELKSGWYVFTTQLSSKVFGEIGVTFLGIFCAASVVGVFSAIHKIPKLLVMAWSPISQVLYPIASQRITLSFQSGKMVIYKMRRIFLCFFILISIIIAVFAKPVISIAFGPEYENYFFWIYPLLAWVIVGINNNFLGIQILLGSGHDKEYSQCFQIGVLCTIIFNLVFAYFWGGLGASFAPLLSETILFFLLKAKIRKIERLDCNE